MKLKEIFNEWAVHADQSYAEQQWLLSKWEVVEGVRWSQEKIRVMLDSIIDGLGLTKRDRVVDLGCGGGWISQALKPTVSEIIDLDLSFNMLEVAKRIAPRDKFVCGELSALPFAAGSFDRAFSYFVFINIMDDHYVNNSFLEIYRVLKKGGRALIGQMPDKTLSRDYDAAKSKYFSYCEQNFKLGKSIRDQDLAPLRLFDKDDIGKFLNEKGIPFRFVPSFNPFYFSGEASTVPWRFDIILEKS